MKLQTFILGFLLSILFVQEACSYEYKTRYFEQPVDHFSFRTNDTYMQRYLISTKYWKKSGPIFFYTGNEGDIEVFANNTGFMWENAPEFGAMIVFAEHRFYGKSYPYPQKENRFGLLTSEQALADHASLTLYLKHAFDADSSPVIAFGGSYGGMLALWIRIKYPHIFDGALAASAPVLQFSGMVPCEAYAMAVTRAYKWGGDACPGIFKKAFGLIAERSKSESGLAYLTKVFKLCKPLKSDELTDWITGGLQTIAMANYPYPNEFLGPMPAWPVKKMCKFLANTSATEHEILTGVLSAMSVYFNHSSAQPKCIDLSFNPMNSLGADNWNYQACTEMIMPMCFGSPKDMFASQPWNLTDYDENCAETFGVNARPFQPKLMYGGAKLQAASNIIYSNGDLDPWSGGGIHKSINPTVIALEIKDGAHHLDLRNSNPLDPPSVRKVRAIEKKWIKLWIKQAREAKPYPYKNA